MTKFTSPVLWLALLVSLGACTSSSYKKTPSGIMYRIVSAGKGQLVKRGEILKFHYSQKLNDSVMYSSFNAVPGYAKADSVGPVYSPLEVFSFLHKGDSVQIVQLADTLLKRMPPGQQAIIKKGDKITLTLRVIDILQNDALVQPDQMKEMEAETTREDAAIRDYLSKNKVSTQKTPRGVYVAVKSPGEGVAIDSGKYVSVTYTGRLFPTGKITTEKVFETNAGREPIGFVVNSGQVIPGWDEGMKLLKKGGKATLYIPSTLAYGQQATPPIKPFDNLIFDVEVVDVANAAPAPKQLPPMPMQQSPATGGQTPPGGR